MLNTYELSPKKYVWNFKAQKISYGKEDYYMEYLDIVDEYGNPTGQIAERKEVHTKGLRHRTAHVWLWRRKDGILQILLQKRSNNKDSFPGCYDISSAGHVPAGCGYEESAVRELYEELGIEADKSELKYCGTRKLHSENIFHGEKFCESQVSKVYIMECHCDENDFVLQESEVESVKWFEYEKCLEMLKNDEIEHCIFIEEYEMLRSHFSIPM